MFYIDYLWCGNGENPCETQQYFNANACFCTQIYIWHVGAHSRLRRSQIRWKSVCVYVSEILAGVEPHWKCLSHISVSLSIICWWKSHVRCLSRRWIPSSLVLQKLEAAPRARKSPGGESANKFHTPGEKNYTRRGEMCQRINLIQQLKSMKHFHREA